MQNTLVRSWGTAGHSGGSLGWEGSERGQLNCCVHTKLKEQDDIVLFKKIVMD